MLSNDPTLDCISRVNEKELWALPGVWAVSQECGAVAIRSWLLVSCSVTLQTNYTAQLLGYPTITWHVGTLSALLFLSSALNSLNYASVVSAVISPVEQLKGKQPARFQTAFTGFPFLKSLLTQETIQYSHQLKDCHSSGECGFLSLS